MKAVTVHGRDGRAELVYGDAAKPRPERNQALVRVEAVGVTRSELTWSSTWMTPTGAERRLTIPGHEFSGIIADIGEGFTDMDLATRVLQTWLYPANAH